jgi:hypothetical protein
VRSKPVGCERSGLLGEGLVADRYCTNCGHSVAQDDRFCAGCGKPVQRTGTVQPSPPPPTLREEQEGELPFTIVSTPLSGHGDTSIVIHDEGVEFITAELRGRLVDSLSYAQIARVRDETGYLFATLIIETGGGAELVSRGLWKGQARKAANLIRARIRR